MLQCVAVSRSCRILQLQCFAVCCSVLKCVEVCCSVLCCAVATKGKSYSILQLQCAAVCAAVCCMCSQLRLQTQRGVLQSGAVCCSKL